MLMLSERQIREIFGMAEALPAIRRAVLDHQRGLIANPHRTVIEFPEREASALYMPTAMPSIGKAAIKVVTIFPQNPLKGMRTTQGVTLLSSSEDGSHLACMDASYLTRLRTGAISGVATECLAKADATTVAVTGCGNMAVEQLEGVLHVRPIRKVVLWSPKTQSVDAFRAMMPQRFPDYRGEVAAAGTADAAVAEADIVIAATRALQPFFRADSLRPGTHINGVGSYLPHMQEIGLDVIARCAKVVVDTLAGVKDEAGDFLIPIAAGQWAWDRLHGEIGQVVAGEIPGRENAEEITFFKSVGVAYFDLAMAAAVYEKAKAMNVGVEVPI